MREKLSRPVSFKSEYEKQYAGIREQLFVCGPKGNVGVWSRGSTRKHARELARRMARHELRMQRQVVVGA